MKYKRITLLKLLCLLIASLLLLAGGCKMRELDGDPSNGDSPEITTTQAGEATDPVSPDVTTTAPEPEPADPRTPAQVALDEAKAERLERFIDLDDCIHGEWRDSANYGVKEKELFNQDGETIGLVLDHTFFPNQDELETYILYFGLNEEGQEIDRHFYGNGQRLKTIIRYFEIDTKAWMRTETFSYDEFGWLWKTESEGTDGRVFSEGVDWGTDVHENPGDGFTTFYQEDYSEDGKSYTVFKKYQYDKNGDFVIGYLYDSKADNTGGKDITEPLPEDPWHQHWMDTYKECHEG